MVERVRFSELPVIDGQPGDTFLAYRDGEVVRTPVPSAGGGGTVTSVGVSAPSGFEVAGSPVVSSGTITISFAAGYGLPTTDAMGQWSTAYSWGDHAIAGYALASSLAPVATSGSYLSLDDLPTIPPAPVNADWNASSGMAEILNKPAIIPYPGNGIPVSTGSAWGTSKDAPSGDIVGTTDAQTLTNKTLGAASAESVATGLSVIDIDDNSTPFQVITLAANSTAEIELSVGVSRTIFVNPGTYTITWPVGSILVGNVDSLPASKISNLTMTGWPGGLVEIALVGSEP